MHDNILRKSYRSTVILVMLATVLFTGLNGLIAFLLLVFFSKFNFGRDPDFKHGLSPGKSRLGGIAIFFSIVIGCCSNLFLRDDLTIPKFISEFDLIIILSLFIAFIGMAEDLSQSLSSLKRLLYILILVSSGLYFKPDLVPIDLEIFTIIGINGLSIPIYIFTIIMVSGFINAGNIADGANGLLASIFLSFFIIAYSIDNTIFNFTVVTTLLAFIIFNVFTGKIFLGDFGAYFLSSLVAFKSLQFYSNNEVSVFFLGMILIYPCFELMRSLIIRSIKSSSVMSPDNNHLHNHINTFLLSFALSKHLSNSITGIGIAFSTTIIPMILFFSGVPINSDLWKILFLIELISLSLIYLLFEKKFSG